MTAAALWYLLRTTARNRLRRQIARVRNPRYALAFVLGLVYFWFVFLRPGAPRPPDGDPITGSVMPALLAIIFVLVIAYSWIFGADRTSLAFSPAEVAMLFPAPVSRRALIVYKLARTQLTILISTMFWVILTRRGVGPLPGIFRAVALWTVFSTLSMHRLGIALLRSGMTEFGAGGARRSVPAVTVIVVILATIGAGLWGTRGALQAAPDASALVRTVLAAFEAPPAGIALLPFTLLFAPFFTTTVVAWGTAMVPALVILGLNTWWVLRSDAAFEEVAAEASAKQAKRLADFRARRTVGGVVTSKSAKRTIALRPTGPPAVAILWKNTIWLLRTGQLRGLLLPAGLAAVATIIFGRNGGQFGTIIGSVSVVFALMLLLFGPIIMRNDLRSDLLHLPMLKTLPLAGRDVVLVQILSGASVIAVAQLLLVWIGGFAFSLSAEARKVPAEALFAAMIAAPALLLVLTGAMFALHNGAALLFPGWVRLGEHAPGGIEAMGQMMMMSVAMLLSMTLLLMVPVLGGAIAWFAFRAELGTAVLAAMLVTAALLAAELFPLIAGLGRAFDRVEPTQVV